MTTLTYTPVSGTPTEVVFRSPYLGDSRRPHAKCLWRRARDGTQYGYKFTSPLNTIDMRFGDMNRPKVEELLALLKVAAGKPLTLTMDDGTQWLGHVETDPFTSQHDGKKNSTFTLRFEGTLIPE